MKTDFRKVKIKLFVTLQLEIKEIQKTTRIYDRNSNRKTTVWETAELRVPEAQVSLSQHAFTDIWDALLYDA